MPVTIHDLAKLAGLNASTISRALRNDPRVRKSTRELVRELARRHGYTPNLPARQLAAGRSGNIWFSFGSPQAAIELETAMALNDLVTRGKYDLQLVLHNNSPERLRQHLNKLCQKVADGVLVIPPGDTDACAGLTGLVNSLPVPVIMVDRYWAGLECPVVTSDNREPVRRMIDRCVEWGARSFYLEYAGSNPVSRNRAGAARACLAERESAGPALPGFGAASTMSFRRPCSATPAALRRLDGRNCTARFSTAATTPRSAAFVTSSSAARIFRRSRSGPHRFFSGSCTIRRQRLPPSRKSRPANFSNSEKPRPAGLYFSSMQSP